MIRTEASKLRITIEVEAPELDDDDMFIHATEAVIRRRLELLPQNTVKIEVIK